MDHITLLNTYCITRWHYTIWTRSISVDYTWLSMDWCWCSWSNSSSFITTFSLGCGSFHYDCLDISRWSYCIRNTCIPWASLDIDRTRILHWRLMARLDDWINVRGRRDSQIRCMELGSVHVLDNSWIGWNHGRLVMACGLASSKTRYDDYWKVGGDSRSIHN